MTSINARSLRLALALLACVVLTLPAAALDRAPSARAKPLTVAGVSYLPRWNSDTQFEYTPKGQEDLERWSEMITLVDVPGMTSPAKIGQYRDMLRAASAKSGAVLGEQCIPDARQPTECWLSAALKGNGLVETTLSRIAVVNGVGMVAMFAHREYGPQAADRSTAWLRSPAGDRANAAWLTWSLSDRPR